MDTHTTTFAALLLLAIANGVAQVPAPQTDENGNFRLPTAETFEAFHATLPVEKLKRSKRKDSFAGDKARSLTLFGQGRLAFQRALTLEQEWASAKNAKDDALAARLRSESDAAYAKSMQAYQRAWQWNPGPKSILADIPSIAFQLDQRQVAYRYAIIAGERDRKNPQNRAEISGMRESSELVSDLGMMIASEGQSERGLELIKSALETHSAEVQRGERLAKDELAANLHFNHARVCMIEEMHQDAADSFDVLADLIANPKPYLMDDAAVSALVEPERVFYGLMAESYLLSGQLAKATNAYDRLDEINGNADLHTYHKALLAFHRGDIPDCQAKLKSYFESQSNSAGEAPYNLLDEIFNDEYPDDKTKKRLLKAIQKLTLADPSNEVLAEYAGHLFVTHKRYEAAREVLEPLLAGEPTIRTFSSLMETYRRLDLPGKTVALLGVAVDRTGELTLVDEALNDFAKDETAIQSFLAEANRRREDSRRPMAGSEAFGVALVCLAAQEFEQADLFYEASVQQTRDDETNEDRELIWAEDALFADHLPAARKYFSKVIESPTENVSVNGISELLALAHEQAGETEMALSVIDAALKVSPDSPGLLARRGWVLYHAHRPEEAAKTYRRVIGSFADDYSNESVRRALKDSRSFLSNILVEQGDVEAAAELLQQILDEYPEDVGAWNDLGYLWADTKRHTGRALQMARAAVAARPDDAAYLDTLAWALFRMGKKEEALKHLERATTELEADDSVILEHLADVYASMGQGEKATNTWRKAIHSLRQFAKDKGRALTEKEELDLKKIKDKLEKE